MSETAPPRQPWWSEGLPFECTQCGECCHGRGGYQFVYVNDRERKELAEHLGLGAEEFLERYTVFDEDGYPSLRFVDGHCVFLEGTRCRVHEAKPVQCRTWPFWLELLESPETYQREVLDFCPGSRQGERVPAAQIRDAVERTEEALYADDDEGFGGGTGA